MEEDDSEGRMVENGYSGLRGGGALNVVKNTVPKTGGVLHAALLQHRSADSEEEERLMF